jgi:hypothetical protein
VKDFDYDVAVVKPEEVNAMVEKLVSRTQMKDRLCVWREAEVWWRM